MPPTTATHPRAPTETRSSQPITQPSESGRWIQAQQDVDGADLIHALEDVAAHRQVVLAPLSEALPRAAISCSDRYLLLVLEGLR
jgi:hypothetical protein